jgi:hypothetical protein
VTATDLARADPIPRVVSWLADHPALAAELGGAGRVGLFNRPPYPLIRVTDPPGGDDRDLLWLIAKNLQLEAYGDLSGAPGKAQLHRILYVALGALMELPDQVITTGGPVITAVRSTGAVAWSPEPSGQPRYVATVHVYAHAIP